MFSSHLLLQGFNHDWLKHMYKNGLNCLMFPLTFFFNILKNELLILDSCRFTEKIAMIDSREFPYTLHPVFLIISLR